MDKTNKNITPPIKIVRKRNIPKELKKLKFWGLWSWQFKKLWTKIPKDKNFNSISASDFNLTFEQAHKLHKKHPEKFSGIGLYFSPDHDYFGVDFDDCVKDGKIKKKIKSAIDKLDSYYELSPSGGGIHVIAKGSSKLNGVDRKFIFSDTRYLTFSGETLNNDNRNVRDCGKVANSLFGVSHKGAKSTNKHDSVSVNEIKQIIKNIRPDIDGGEWYKVCKAIHYKTGGSEEGFNLFVEWSSGAFCKKKHKYKSFNVADCEYRWRKCKTNIDNPVGMPSLRELEALYPTRKIKKSKLETPKSPNELKKAVFNSESLSIKHLPKKLQKSAQEVSRFNKINPDPIVTSMLLIFSAAINKKVIINERGGLTHHCSMGAIIGMKSGGRKSSVDDQLLKPYFDFEKERVREWEKESHKNQAAVRVLRQKLKSVEHIKTEEEGGTISLDDKIGIMANYGKQIAKYDKPKPKFIESDATEERLSDIMDKNNETIFIQSDDARNTINNITGRYDTTSENIYIAGLTQSTYRRSRVKDDIEITMYDPCLNMLLKVQIDKLLNVVGEDTLRESGLIARLFLKVVDIDLGYQIKENETDKDLSLSKMKPYYETLNTVLSYDGPTVNIYLSEKAQELRRQFTHEYADKLEGVWNKFHDVSNKIITLSVKMALVWAVMENPYLLEESKSGFGIPSFEISAKQYRKGKEIVNILMNQTLECLSGVELNSLIDGAITLYEKLKDIVEKTELDSFTISEIKFRYSTKKRPFVEQWVSVLVDNGFVEQIGQRYKLV